MAYDNRSRSAAAAQTRERVLRAARESFLGVGWAGTTIRAVARAAGVSPETVYKVFGSKAALFKAVYDVALAGDDEPVPMAARPEFRALRQAATPAEVAAAYGQLARTLSERAGPLLALVLTARGSDPDLEAFAATTDAERLVGATMAVREWHARGFLRPGLEEGRARDQLWTFNSPAVFHLFAARGWSGDDYAAWLASTLAATVLRAG